mgnify:CR=1 FL=1
MRKRNRGMLGKGQRKRAIGKKRIGVKGKRERMGKKQDKREGGAHRGRGQKREGTKKA